MNNSPVVSVIMLAYNHEKYIEQAIQSVLEQETSFPYELIIGEDCSTDGTRDIVMKYQKKYPDIIHPLYHEKNLGTTKNVYRVIQEAKGRYIAACEGDDFWCDKKRLQKHVDFLETHKEYVGISGRCRVVDAMGNGISSDAIENRLKFWEFSKPVYTLKDYECWKLPGHGSALTRRNIYLDKNLDYSITYQASDMVGDRTSMLLNLMYGNIYCSEDVVSCYRLQLDREAGNFMSKSRYRNLRDQDFLMMCRLEEWCKEKRNLRLDLSIPKKDRLIGSVVVWMKEPTAENFKVLKRIVKYSKKPLKYVVYAMRVFFKKLYYWKVKKVDKPIVL